MSFRARQIALEFDRRRNDIASGSKRRRFRLPPVEAESKELMELVEELLPGINNEITLTHIFPRLPWRTLLALSSVCRDWKRALGSSHRNYHERVRSCSTETLAVVDVTIPGDRHSTIALYSVRDKRFYYVPPVPHSKGFSWSYECVAMDGKLYAFRGILNSWTRKEGYVLDLLGDRRWRQCEYMRNRRRDEFGCAVMHGKIYVFGGCNERDEPVAGAEVYDPTLDSWSPIPYSGLRRSGHRVTVVGDELVLHGGMDYQFNDDGPDEDQFFCKRFEFYNPVTKEYRVVDGFDFEEMDMLSGTQGTFYSVRWEDMCAHAIDEHGTFERTHLRSFSTENVPPFHRAVIDGNEESMTVVDESEPFSVIAVDDELLAVVHWIDTQKWIEGSCLVRSRGFSTENSQISWEEAPCCGKHSLPEIHSIKCSIQL